MLNIYKVISSFDDGLESYPVDCLIVYAATPERAIQLTKVSNAEAEQIGWKTGEQEEGYFSITPLGVS